MGMQFRVLYRNPAPRPATEWDDVTHGDTAFADREIMAIQFRDPDQPIDEADPKYYITHLFNDAVTIMTDDDGNYVERSNEELAEMLDLPLERVEAIDAHVKGIEL